MNGDKKIFLIIINESDTPLTIIISSENYAKSLTQDLIPLDKEMRGAGVEVVR